MKKPPRQDINKLFERFYMGDKARIGNYGSGHGLAILKRIVELHNGKITADCRSKKITFQVDNHYVQISYKKLIPVTIMPLKNS